MSQPAATAASARATMSPAAMRARHAQVVGEDEPVELQASAQDVLQPDPRKAGGDVVDRRIDHVRGHHGLEPFLRQHREGNEVVGKQRVERAFVHREVDVRIRGDETVSGKVLAHARRSRRR